MEPVHDALLRGHLLGVQGLRPGTAHAITSRYISISLYIYI